MEPEITVLSPLTISMWCVSGALCPSGNFSDTYVQRVSLLLRFQNIESVVLLNRDQLIGGVPQLRHLTFIYVIENRSCHFRIRNLRTGISDTH